MSERSSLVATRPMLGLPGCMVPPFSDVWHQETQGGKVPAVGAPVEVHVGGKGRIVIPASVRTAAEVSEGEVLFVRADAPGRVVLETREAIKARLQHAAALAKGTSVQSVVESLLQDRRADAELEKSRLQRTPDPPKASVPKREGATGRRAAATGGERSAARKVRLRPKSQSRAVS